MNVFSPNVMAAELVPEGGDGREDRLDQALLEEQQSSVEFVYGLNRADLEKLLEKQEYTPLQADLYYKFDYNEIDIFQWVYNHISFDKKDSVYDPCFLYICLRGCFYKIEPPKSFFSSRKIISFTNADKRIAYKSFLMLAIIAFADAFAAMNLGYGDNASKAYDFLIGKIGRLWLPTIVQYDFSFEHIFFELIRIFVVDPHSEAFVIKRAFLDDQLRSAAWMSCSYGSWNTFYFCQADKTVNELFEARKIAVRAHREVAILKILNIIKALKGQSMAGKMTELAGKTFSQILAEA